MKNKTYRLKDYYIDFIWIKAVGQYLMYIKNRHTANFDSDFGGKRELIKKARRMIAEMENPEIKAVADRIIHE